MTTDDKRTQPPFRVGQTVTLGSGVLVEHRGKRGFVTDMKPGPSGGEVKVQILNEPARWFYSYDCNPDPEPATPSASPFTSYGTTHEEEAWLEKLGDRIPGNKEHRSSIVDTVRRRLVETGIRARVQPVGQPTDRVTSLERAIRNYLDARDDLDGGGPAQIDACCRAYLALQDALEKRTEQASPFCGARWNKYVCILTTGHDGDHHGHMPMQGSMKYSDAMAVEQADIDRSVNAILGPPGERTANPLDEAWNNLSCDDAPLPEDPDIRAAGPARTGRHDLFTEAFRLVGAKRSKMALVYLVNWLLHRIAQPVADAKDDIDARYFAELRRLHTYALDMSKRYERWHAGAGPEYDSPEHEAMARCLGDIERLRTPQGKDGPK